MSLIKSRLIVKEGVPRIQIGDLVIYGLTGITAIALIFKFYRVFEEVKTIPPEERTIFGLIKRLVFAL